jgi:hypothetical protein
VDFLRVRFAALGGFSVDVMPAIPEVNPLFRAASIAFVRPLSLASALGRVSEHVGRRALVRAYAEGVICGSPSPEADGWGRKEWIAWLEAHPDEFDWIRNLASRAKVWEQLLPGSTVDAGLAPEEPEGATGGAD